jgi:hypothetical protein
MTQPLRRTSSDKNVLSQRVLNRITLERQLLLRRSNLTVAETLVHLVGLQAQAPNAAYIGLWTRLENFMHDDLAQMIMDRCAARIALMRSTIHLVTERDALGLRPLLQPVLDRDLYKNGTHAKGIAGLNVEEVISYGQALLEEKPRTIKEMGELLSKQWPEHPASALAYTLRNLLPLVQVPPRGIWGVGGQTRCTTATHWFGRSVEEKATLEDTIMRYLMAFGPATIQDMQTWSGLTKLQAVVDRLRPHLLTYRDEYGRELFDAHGAPYPHPDTPAPPRFLPEYDNLLVSHANRTRVIMDDHRRRIMTNNGMKATVLLDGFVYGTWKIVRQRSTAVLVIEPFGKLSGREQNSLSEEGIKLLQFAATEATEHEIQFAGET